MVRLAAGTAVCVCYSPKGILLAVPTRHTSVQRNNKCVVLQESVTGKLGFKPQEIWKEEWYFQRQLDMQG